jgi:hypothetical protein
MKGADPNRNRSGFLIAALVFLRYAIFPSFMEKTFRGNLMIPGQSQKGPKWMAETAQTKSSRGVMIWTIIGWQW